MERTDKKIERTKEELSKLHNKVVKAKKFTKLKDWKQFRANVNKPLADWLKSVDVKKRFEE